MQSTPPVALQNNPDTPPTPRTRLSTAVQRLKDAAPHIASTESSSSAAGPTGAAKAGKELLTSWVLDGLSSASHTVEGGRGTVPLLEQVLTARRGLAASAIGAEELLDGSGGAKRAEQVVKVLDRLVEQDEGGQAEGWEEVVGWAEELGDAVEEQRGRNEKAEAQVDGRTGVNGLLPSSSTLAAATQPKVDNPGSHLPSPASSPVSRAASLVDDAPSASAAVRALAGEAPKERETDSMSPGADGQGGWEEREQEAERVPSAHSVHVNGTSGDANADTAAAAVAAKRKEEVKRLSASRQLIRVKPPAEEDQPQKGGASEGKGKGKEQPLSPFAFHPSASFPFHPSASFPCATAAPTGAAGVLVLASGEEESVEERVPDSAAASRAASPAVVKAEQRRSLTPPPAAQPHPSQAKLPDGLEDALASAPAAGAENDYWVEQPQQEYGGGFDEPAFASPPPAGQAQKENAEVDELASSSPSRAAHGKNGDEQDEVEKANPASLFRSISRSVSSSSAQPVAQTKKRPRAPSPAPPTSNGREASPELVAPISSPPPAGKKAVKRARVAAAKTKRGTGGGGAGRRGAPTVARPAKGKGKGKARQDQEDEVDELESEDDADEGGLVALRKEDFAGGVKKGKGKAPAKKGAKAVAPPPSKAAELRRRMAAVNGSDSSADEDDAGAKRKQVAARRGPSSSDASDLDEELLFPADGSAKKGKAKKRSTPEPASEDSGEGEEADEEELAPAAGPSRARQQPQPTGKKRLPPTVPKPVAKEMKRRPSTSTSSRAPPAKKLKFSPPSSPAEGKKRPSRAAALAAAGGISEMAIKDAEAAARARRGSLGRPLDVLSPSKRSPTAAKRKEKAVAVKSEKKPGRVKDEKGKGKSKAKEPERKKRRTEGTRRGLRGAADEQNEAQFNKGDVVYTALGMGANAWPAVVLKAEEGARVYLARLPGQGENSSRPLKFFLALSPSAYPSHAPASAIAPTSAQAKLLGGAQKLAKDERERGEWADKVREAAEQDGVLSEDSEDEASDEEEDSGEDSES
ncbi:hypothetical protein JCM10213v2_008984 [Rhodosporidiobolus nylandii]